MKIIHKLQERDLRGRGGAEFPVAFKWLSVLKARLEDIERPVYVVCNAAEGEPGITKDMYILRHHAKEVVEGMTLAMETFDAKEGFIYIKQKNYKKLKSKLDRAVKGKNISIFTTDGGYVCGEETTLLNSISGERREPRIKPPYPTEKGLYDQPTLVNNVESYYFVHKIDKNDYHHTRFYSIGGDVKRPGVYELSEKMTMAEVLKATGNVPRFKYFAQVGGGAAGEIYLPEELDCRLCGAGSIIIYNQKNTQPKDLMKKWIKFFYNENCGQCVPCREGMYRLKAELNKEKPNWVIIRAILHTQKDTSLCPLGKSAYYPMISLMEKVGIGRNKKIKRLKD